MQIYVLFCTRLYILNFGQCTISSVHNIQRMVSVAVKIVAAIIAAVLSVIIIVVIIVVATSGKERDTGIILMYLRAWTLKYGSCNKSLPKNANLNKWTLEKIVCYDSLLQIPFSEEKSIQLFRVAFSEITSYKIRLWNKV